MAAKDLVGPAFVGSDTSSFIVTRGITAPGTPYRSRWAPGGCCCCGVHIDSFNRANHADIGASTGYGNWEDIVGSWSIISNAARVSTPNAILKSLVRRTTADGGRDSVHITTFAKASAAGDKIRVIAGYQDADNYLFGEVSFGTGKTISIGSRAGGTDTILETKALTATFSLNTFYRLIMCVDQANGFMSFYAWTGGTTGGFASSSITPSGQGYVALGTGGTCTGNVDFNSIDVQRTTVNHLGDSTGCEECLHSLPCEACDGFGLPEEYMVSVGSTSIWANTSPPEYLGCDEVKGDYILTREDPDNYPCRWGYTEPLYSTEVGCYDYTVPRPWSLRIELNLRPAVGVGAGVFTVTFTIADAAHNIRNDAYLCGQCPSGAPPPASDYCGSRYEGNDTANPTNCRGPVTLAQITSGTALCSDTVNDRWGDYKYNGCWNYLLLARKCLHKDTFYFPSGYNPVTTVTVTAVA